MSERHGQARVVRLDGAPAIAGIVYDLPGVERLRVTAVAFTLVSSGNAANRLVVVQLLDGTGAAVYGVAAPVVQTAGLSVVYSFAPDVPPFGTAAQGFVGGPFPGGELPENLTLTVNVVNADGGDLLADGRLLVRQWSRLDQEV